MINSLPQYFLRSHLLLKRNCRYLKLSQIYWRLRRQTIKKPKLSSIHAGPRNIDLDLWTSSILKKSPLIAEHPWKFNFLNQPGSIEQGWNDPRQSKLWLYNLHYHDFLLSDINIEIKIFLISDWIKKNPPQEDNGWEPYTLSLRIVN